MRVKMDQPILDLKGKVAIRDQIPFLLRDACQESLVLPHASEPNLSVADKLQRFELAMKLNPHVHDDGTKDDEVDLTMEEIVKIKELVGIMQNALVVGRVHALFAEKKLKIAS